MPVKCVSALFESALPVFLVLSTFMLGNGRIFEIADPSFIALRFTVPVFCIGCTTFLVALGLRKLKESS